MHHAQDINNIFSFYGHFIYFNTYIILSSRHHVPGIDLQHFWLRHYQFIN
jgi:hypothetical protein